MDFTGLSVVAYSFGSFSLKIGGFAPVPMLNCLLRIAEMAVTEGEFLEIRQITGSALTDERHGNKVLKNGQHFFTRRRKCKIV
jgi:hypothetical protein